MINHIIKDILAVYKEDGSKRIESQRFTEKYMLKHSHLEEYEYLKEHDIVSIISLYNFLFPNQNVCKHEKCSKTPRFINFETGYRQYCKEHIRFNKNVQPKIVLEADLDFKYRKELKNILNSDIVKDTHGNYSSSKLVEYSPKIDSTTFYLDIDSKAPQKEKIYHIVNDLYEIQTCKICQNRIYDFISNVDGYRSEYCKEHRTRKKHTRSEESLKVFYNRYREFYVDKNAGLDEEYTIHMFSIEDYVNRKAQVVITHNCGYTYTESVSAQHSLACSKCYNKKSLKELEVKAYVESLKVTVLSNDRKIIKPKELDIVVPEHKFAIEYDGQAYHSFGISNFPPLNNYKLDHLNHHLYKTNKCEEVAYQLYHIFSSEWHDLNKQDIWKSIIASKVGKTTRVYARKCIVKEVQNKEAKDFLESNHMQGYINAKIKIGLYYNDELLSITTYSKPRYSTEEYELIRFATRKYTTVVGGASKMLKYFERTYSPKSLISYANRRWSQGNVYEKLGFSYKYTTAANKFYIRENNSDMQPLLSRIGFQKHRINKFMQIDENLSTKENIYKNGYRVIYDSGNKVYVKEYLSL